MAPGIIASYRPVYIFYVDNGFYEPAEDAIE